MANSLKILTRKLSILDQERRELISDIRKHRDWSKTVVDDCLRQLYKKGDWYIPVDNQATPIKIHPDKAFQISSWDIKPLTGDQSALSPECSLTIVTCSASGFLNERKFKIKATRSILPQILSSFHILSGTEIKSLQKDINAARAQKEKDLRKAQLEKIIEEAQKEIALL